MYNKIFEHYPRPDTYDIYVEPFSGTYTMGLHLQPLPKIEVFNDLNRNVYCLYKVLKDETLFNEFRRLVELTPYSEDVRKDAKENLKRDDLTELERAYSYFVFNRMSHNGIGGFSVNVAVRRNMSKSVSDFLSVVERLPELHDRLSRVIVCNRDALELMDKYSDENCFLYCDPPYVWSTRNSNERYQIDQPDEFHEKFIDKCLVSRAKILISGYDNRIYDRLTVQNRFRKVSFDVNTCSASRQAKTKTETLWMNY